MTPKTYKRKWYLLQSIALKKLLNDEKYHDFTSNGNYIGKNKIKNGNIYKNYERSLNNKEHDYYFKHNK